MPLAGEGVRNAEIEKGDIGLLAAMLVAGTVCSRRHAFVRQPVNGELPQNHDNIHRGLVRIASIQTSIRS